MNEYGVWIKNGADQTLVYTDTMMGCQRYTEIETAKNPDLKHRWRIGILPNVLVSLKTKSGLAPLAAFDSETDAALFVNDYVRHNTGKVENSDIDIALKDIN